jgi:hypothetical protein
MSYKPFIPLFKVNLAKYFLEIYHIKNKNSLLTCSNTTDKVNKGKSSSNSSTNKIPNEKAVLKKDNNKNIVLDLQKDGKS